MMRIDFLKYKSDAKTTTQKLIVEAQATCKKKVLLMKTDNAKELKPSEFLLENETASQNIPPYSPESNARVEITNRTIVECARTLLQDFFTKSNIKDYKALWPEASRCAVYIPNRTLTKRTHESLRGITPYEILTGEKPDLSHLRIFGSKVKVALLQQSKTNKLNKKTWDGFHVGYAAGNSYRIFIPALDRVFVTKDVIFCEKLHREIFSTLPEPEDTEDNDDILDKNYSLKDEKGEIMHILKHLLKLSQKGLEHNIESEGLANEERYGRRIKKPSGIFALALLTAEHIQGNDSREVMNSVEQALKSPEKNEWVQSLREEIISLTEMGTYEIA